jgi:hypothetical protein
MLYDNAQLARTYLHAWQLTGEETYRRIAIETLDYVLREMTSPEGGFYSTQDADSEGQEGKFFLWSPEEVTALLGPEDALLFCAYYDVTAAGNFHEGGAGANILHVGRTMAEVAREQGVAVERMETALSHGREILFAARETRVRPGRDEKILAEWNGLMIHAFAEAGAVLDRSEYLAAAENAADFLLSRMSATGIAEVAFKRQSTIGNRQFAIRLFRTYKDGRARLNATLEDYAALAQGLIALYEAAFDLRWLLAADDLARTILEHFGDPQGTGFFQTGDDHERLVARRKDFVDSAVPSGNSLAAGLFLRLGALLGRQGYADKAAGTMQLMADAMGAQPSAFGRLLCALDFYLNPGYEIAIVGDPAAGDTRALLAEVRRRFLPNSVLASCRPGDEEAARFTPLLAGRTVRDGPAAAYVCHDFVCQAPVTEVEELRAQLELG